MSKIEINEELGLRFSSASLGSLEFPEQNRDLVFISAEDRLAIILDGFGPCEGLNRVALASLLRGFNSANFAEQFEGLQGKVNEIFLRAHYDVFDEKRGSESGGVSSTAVQFTEINRLKLGIFGHVGFTRLYKMHDGILKLWSLDTGWYVNHDNPNNERDLMEILDDIRTPDEAELYLHDGHLQNLWSENTHTPLTYLGVTRPQRLEVVQASFIPILTGDKMVMTTVGVHRHLNRFEMTEIISQDSPAQTLVEQAHLRTQNINYFRKTPLADFSAIVIEDISPVK